MSTSRNAGDLPESLWAATAPPSPRFPAMERDRPADVCVIGGGFTGLSTALHAALAGASVVVLEAAAPGWGASGRNGGQVIPGLKWDPDTIEQRFGSERGGRLVDFVGSAPDLVFALIARHQIKCSARRDGWIHAVHAAAALLRSIFGDDDAERPKLMGKPPQYRCRLGASFSRRQRYCYWQARAQGWRGRSWTSGTRPSSRAQRGRWMLPCITRTIRSCRSRRACSS